eukprot:SAG11_NODE_61_length_19011_cov_49.624048_27_plen_168_part_00
MGSVDSVSMTAGVDMSMSAVDDALVFSGDSMLLTTVLMSIDATKAMLGVTAALTLLGGDSAEIVTSLAGLSLSSASERERLEAERTSRAAAELKLIDATNRQLLHFRTTRVQELTDTKLRAESLLSEACAWNRSIGNWRDPGSIQKSDSSINDAANCPTLGHHRESI